jgi:hypothetical protein
MGSQSKSRSLARNKASSQIKIADQSDLSNFFFKSRTAQDEGEEEEEEEEESSSDDSGFIIRGWLKYFTYIPSEEHTIEDKPEKFDYNEEWVDQ